MKDIIPVTQPTIPRDVRDEYAREVRNIIESKTLSNWGPWCGEFEKAVERRTGARFAISFPSADVALIALISALDLECDTHVALPSFTFNSTANCLLWNRLLPYFIDVDRNTFLPSDPVIRTAAWARKAYLLTHTFGNPCDVTTRTLHGSPVLFDGAHALGATYKGTPVGKYGTATVFSFSGTKILTCGEGGMVTTDSVKLWRRLLFSRGYGFRNNYLTRRMGLNGKMSEFHACLGALLMPHLDRFIKRREELAHRYMDVLLNSENFRKFAIQMNPVNIGSGRVWNNFAVLIDKADRVQKRLAAKGIQTKRYFKPLHLMPFYGGWQRGGLPNTEFIADRILVLPLFTHMTYEQQVRVISELRKAVK